MTLLQPAHPFFHYHVGTQGEGAHLQANNGTPLPGKKQPVP